jgi:hypothetical protein
MRTHWYGMALSRRCFRIIIRCAGAVVEKVRMRHGTRVCLVGDSVVGEEDGKAVREETALLLCVLASARSSTR